AKRVLARSDELLVSVDDGLRRVALSIHPLARAPLGLRKWIGPAEIVPVVDVKLERDHAFRIERAQDIVRGRTARAAFRREKLDHDGAGTLRLSGRRAHARNQKHEQQAPHAFVYATSTIPVSPGRAHGRSRGRAIVSRDFSA